MHDELFGEEYLDWVKKHSGEDPDRLRLSFHGDGRPWIPFAITQIANERRAVKKFLSSTGESMAPAILASDIALQQSTSADIALLHAGLMSHWLPEKANVIDMTCGLGTDTRALSRLFNVASCELNPLHASMARENFRGNGNVTIVEGDSVEFLSAQPQGRYDGVFIDPARRDNLGRRVYGIHDCTPDLIEIMPLLSAKCRVAMCKLSPMLDITQTLIDLPSISEIHVIGDGRECKELVAIIDFEKEIKTPDDIEISIWPNALVRSLTFTLREESIAKSLDYVIPEKGGILWIPGATAMKAGCFNLLSSEYGLNPIASNTHLYVSDEYYLDSFPGHGEEIIDVVPWKSSELKRLKRRGLKAGVRVKNFGLTADQLASKIGVGCQSTESLMVTGMTLNDKSKMLVISRRL